MITVERVKISGEIALEDVNYLLKQLRTDVNEPPGTQSDLDAIVSDPHVIFVVARDDRKTIGIGTIYLATKFGKKTGFVEDVVVDESYRGQGLGRKVMETLIDESKKQNATQLYLTTRPERVAAHKLYESLGFKEKDTDVYKLHF
jgi:ribosomal protein S18 acetylase RimI-like enzyme